MGDVTTIEDQERERAEAIAKDRRTIMASVRSFSANAVSFARLPMRWFDDWTRTEPVVPPRPEGGYRWDAPATDPLEDIQRASPMCGLMLKTQLSPEYRWRPKTPEEQDAYVRSFQGQWPRGRGGG